MYKIFGYGTFITRKMYKGKRDVRAAFLPDYFRVFSGQDWYPYVININEIKESDMLKGEIFRKPGFWGLIFTVNEEELKKLDIYEGNGTLYERIIINCILNDGKNEKAFIYYPKAYLIKEKNLISLVSYGDLWKEKIINEFPEILSEFPELKK